MSHLKQSRGPFATARLWEENRTGVLPTRGRRTCQPATRCKPAWFLSSAADDTRGVGSVTSSSSETEAGATTRPPPSPPGRVARGQRGRGGAQSRLPLRRSDAIFLVLFPPRTRQTLRHVKTPVLPTGKETRGGGRVVGTRRWPSGGGSDFIADVPHTAHLHCTGLGDGGKT